MLSVDYFSGVVVLHGPPTCARVWTNLAASSESVMIISKRLTEEQLNVWYTQAVEYNKQQGMRTLFVLDDPGCSGLGSKSEALNLVAMSGREWGLSLLVITHKLTDTVTPEIRGTLDYVITGALNKATATHIVNDTTIGLDISAAGLREYVACVAPSKRLFVALYAHNKRRPLAPVNVDEDFVSVAGVSEEASDSGSEDDVPIEKRHGKAPTAKELNEWRRRHHKAAAALEESERRERELLHVLDGTKMRAALLEADSARLAANREALLELGVRSKAQSLLREFSRQSVVVSNKVTLSPEYAADVVALLRQLCVSVTPAGDIALHGESDAAERAEAAEAAARDAWEHAVDEAWEREAVEHEGFRPRRSQ